MNKQIIALKGFDQNLMAQGMQFEVGKTYEANKQTAPFGLEFQFNPFLILSYSKKNEYNPSRICKVEIIGEYHECKLSLGAFTATKIRVIEEITFNELTFMALEWIEKQVEKINVIGKPQKQYNPLPSKIISNENDEIITLGTDTTSVKASGRNTTIYTHKPFKDIFSEGSNSKIFFSGCRTNIVSMGYEDVINAKGDMSYINMMGLESYALLSGYHQGLVANKTSYIFSCGKNATIITNANHSTIFSTSHSDIITANGDTTAIISNGDFARITSNGFINTIESQGKEAIIQCYGYKSMVKAKKGSFISFSDWDIDYDDKGMPKHVELKAKTVQVDGQNIKEDTWYTFTKGEIKELQNNTES